ncbi:MAG: hypothetical protein PG977_000089 [Bartonella clarridgeiae]|nr:MAG: hypothetical protein PG977_000089 [Bartonella clarridgeiae]
MKSLKIVFHAFIKVKHIKTINQLTDFTEILSGTMIKKI